ncbi:hypothetical protein PIB30_053547 [Stylosanthes scabra]|uniref:Uncharacterized protein n=1 Tax=Stylosanthes scabra TaxID=79078 RepID=A0ABU6YFZ6_9FABA|nr:hypothetical protein [Stylosanthes scabra]
MGSLNFNFTIKSKFNKLQSKTIPNQFTTRNAPVRGELPAELGWDVRGGTTGGFTFPWKRSKRLPTDYTSPGKSHSNEWRGMEKMRGKFTGGISPPNSARNCALPNAPFQCWEWLVPVDFSPCYSAGMLDGYIPSNRAPHTSFPTHLQSHSYPNRAPIQTSISPPSPFSVELPHRRPSSPSFLAASSSGPVIPSDPPFNFDRRSSLKAQGRVPSEFDATQRVVPASLLHRRHRYISLSSHTSQSLFVPPSSNTLLSIAWSPSALNIVVLCAHQGLKLLNTCMEKSVKVGQLREVSNKANSGAEVIFGCGEKADHLQAKTSSMLPSSTNEHMDLPPGFEDNHFLNQPKVELSHSLQLNGNALLCLLPEMIGKLLPVKIRRK